MQLFKYFQYCKLPQSGFRNGKEFFFHEILTCNKEICGSSVVSRVQFRMLHINELLNNLDQVPTRDV